MVAVCVLVVTLKFAGTGISGGSGIVSNDESEEARNTYLFQASIALA